MNIDLFEQKIISIGNGCWYWTGYKSKQGYGQVRVGDAVLKAHRVAYELWRQPIPTGLTIDHSCRNPSCVNPWHMEPATFAVNSSRGRTARKNAAKTHCPHGHEYTPENTWIYKNRRHCRTCARLHGRRTYRKLYAGPDYKPHLKGRRYFIPEDVQ